ncbi:MAG: GGDEF domain-containing protein [Firmicutes bacterium]|nr:GGDEF domain-containing protein [Bacillota bacterium]
MLFPLKSQLKLEDIFSESIMLIASIIFIVIFWKMYNAYEREKYWSVFLAGIIFYIIGAALDLLDEFFKLPQIIPRIIENSLIAIGISTTILGAIIIMNKLISKANTDVTTGIYNKIFLNKALSLEIERARRYSLPLSLLFIDLNEFKRVNDTMGHATGDLVLRTIAIKIKSLVRKVDIVTRYGGDEFVLILPNSNKNSAEKLLNRLKCEINNMDLPGECRIGISGGISEFPYDGENIDQLINTADRRMYENKYKCE